jgi:hypothetical protein
MRLLVFLLSALGIGSGQASLISMHSLREIEDLFRGETEKVGTKTDVPLVLISVLFR